MPYINSNDKVLDIGCFDGYLFKELVGKPIKNSIGIDPLIEKTIQEGNYILIKGKFPSDLPKNERFDCITMLAVLEHLPQAVQNKISGDFYNYLNSKGRIIITVPSPFVDKILWVLSKLRLIDGMSLEEHYGFEVKQVPEIFDSTRYKLLKHKKFQLGLNNLFVFERKN
nr:methyltransferase domain-containing protein [Hanstruepera marina]